MRLKFWIWVARKALKAHQWVFLHEKRLSRRIEMSQKLYNMAGSLMNGLEADQNEDVKKLLDEVIDQGLAYTCYNLNEILMILQKQQKAE